MRRLRLFCAVLFLIVLFFPQIASPVNVRLSDPVYNYLQRCELKGWVDEPLSGSQPFSRHRIAEHLVAIAQHRDQMSKVEREQLDYYAFQFQDELRALNPDLSGIFESFWDKQGWLPDWLFPNGRDLIHVTGENADDWSVSINAHLNAETYERPDETIGDGKSEHRVIGSGASLRFQYDRWSAAGRISDSHISYTGDAPDSVRFPYESGPAFSTGKTLDFFDATAEIAYEAPHVQVWFGLGEERWAAGETGSFLLNDHAKPYTHFRAKVRFRPFELTTVQARLQNKPRVVTTIDSVTGGIIHEQYAKKWMAAHRIEYFHKNWLRVGLFQQAFYGNREYDIEFLNPLMFVMATEYYNGDTDNILVGGDARILLFNKLELHGQLLFDEFVFSRLFGNDYTNKWAVMAGARLVDPMNLPNSMVWGEYARIRPYVYTHKYPINRATHLGVPLGYQLQPNSEQIAVGWKQTIVRGLRADVNFRLTSHGANPPGENVGGNVSLPETVNGLREEIPLLTGDLEKTSAVGILVTAEPILNLHFGIGVEYMMRTLSPEEGENIEENLTLLMARVQWFPLF